MAGMQDLRILELLTNLKKGATNTQQIKPVVQGLGSLFEGGADKVNKLIGNAKSFKTKTKNAQTGEETEESVVINQPSLGENKTPATKSTAQAPTQQPVAEPQAPQQQSIGQGMSLEDLLAMGRPNTLQQIGNIGQNVATALQGGTPEPYGPSGVQESIAKALASSSLRGKPTPTYGEKETISWLEFFGDEISEGNITTREDAMNQLALYRPAMEASGVDVTQMEEAINSMIPETQEEVPWWQKFKFGS